LSSNASHSRLHSFILASPLAFIDPLTDNLSTSIACPSSLSHIRPFNFTSQAQLHQSHHRTFTMSSDTSSRSLIVLTTSMSLNREQTQNQERAMTLLRARKISFTAIDGANPAEKDR
jgi:hypothetical protein